jgi:hypothetical protein
LNCGSGLTPGINPQAEFVFTSPLQRCQQTRSSSTARFTHLTIPNWENVISACFVIKPMKNFGLIKENQEWLAGGGNLFSPGRKHFAEFCIRSGKGFEKAVEPESLKTKS